MLEPELPGLLDDLGVFLASRHKPELERFRLEVEHVRFKSLVACIDGQRHSVGVEGRFDFIAPYKASQEDENGVFGL